MPPPRVYSANVTIQTDVEKEMPITEIYDVVELPNTPVKLTDEQIIEEFMLEEDGDRFSKYR